MFDRFPLDKNEFDGPVLVTGASGCIGSWTIALLVRAGVQTHALDLKPDTRRPRLLMSEAELARVGWHTGDIGETSSVLRAAKDSGARAIIHLAALQVPFCRADPVAGARANVLGTVNIFETARALGIKRLTYASSVAAYGALEDGGAMPTLYGAYKYCNEQTARVYSLDNGVHSIGIRPGVVYGVGRDQGMTAKTTIAILAAAAGKPYTVPFKGPVSWLFAGEVASAFIRAVARERSGARVLDMNGVYAPVEEGLAILQRIAPAAQVEISGEALAFPMDQSDDPLEQFLGRYGRIALADGIRATYDSFKALLADGRLSAADIT